ncbi:MAG: hypothetical protein WBM32_02445 [Crocosphaera sp.]
MNDSTNWYIIKLETEKCEIIALNNNKSPEYGTYWGPFPSKEESISRRVGLIRAGKCKPQ